jgi:rhodanese-related sulfurtransferase
VSPVKQLQQEELDRFRKDIEEGRCLLLDVREKGEYEAGHLPSAQFMPLSLVNRWNEDLDKRRPVILYCRTQNRSRRCAGLLSNLGFQDVYYLEGGYMAWSVRPRPL